MSQEGTFAAMRVTAFVMGHATAHNRTLCTERCPSFPKAADLLALRNNERDRFHGDVWGRGEHCHP